MTATESMKAETYSPMTTVEDFRLCYSDFYKDAYGFRPRFSTADWTLAEWIAEYDRLAKICEENRIAEAAGEARAVEEFEQQVAGLIAAGAADRTAAIRWICDAEGADGDLSYLAYLRGLPFGFFGKPGTHV